MRRRASKDQVKQIKDPRVEYARLAVEQAKPSAAGGGRQPILPPPAVDGEFCYSEETQR